MRTATVTLAGKEYSIQELPTRKNEAWRGQLEERINPLVEAIKEVAAEDLNAEGLSRVTEPFERVARIAMASPAEVRGMVLAYAPALAEEEDHLLDNAYDSEFMAAFMEVLKLAYPFGGVLQAIQAIQGTATDGSSGPATSGRQKQKK